MSISSRVNASALICLAAFLLFSAVPATGQEPLHWAYTAPERPPLPKVQETSWPVNAIDFFVLSRLEEAALRPAERSDRRTLIRRLSLDLTGLPPTREEVKQFLEDDSAQAYEKLVDRLLASPHYGERWARSWLDMARYADTQGYEKDNRRTIWPYRDWVIQAFNADMPFDQFTREQLAGDLLPNPTQEQLVATGFHRNTMTNTEGGTDDEEFRHAAVVDRVNTTMEVWMGSTFACAQCHNHKYDPFSMKEYYRMYAFFNNTADNDQPDERPTLKVTTPAERKKLEDLETRISELEQEYWSESSDVENARAAWETETLRDLNRWKVVKPQKTVSEGGANLEILEDQSILASGVNPHNDTYKIVFSNLPMPVALVRIEVLPDPSLPKESLGRHPNGSFVLSKVEAYTQTDPGSGRTPLRFTDAKSDYVQKGHDTRSLITDAKGAGWAVDAGQGDKRVRRSLWLRLEQPFAPPNGDRLTLILKHQSQWPEANVGRFRVAVSSNDQTLPPANLPESVIAALNRKAGDRNEDQRKQIDEAFREHSSFFAPLREKLQAARGELDRLDRSLPRTPVMQELQKGRETHMLVRGNFLNPSERVQEGVPASLHPYPEGAPKNRLGLARWLTSTNNPLTARVLMNRIWELYFGIGLVETSEDFGTQGEPPSHPELLDWLATELMNQKWSLKSMHKTIVMSATYQQSSRVTTGKLEKDPYNRLLSRGPRFRLPAEMIRDQALAVSGLLSRELGGPSVMPPQPEGIWQVVYSGDAWQTSKQGDKYRRGLYTFWRRTSPYPSMMTFDAPSREVCVVRRSRSNTPLQALTLLNDPVYVEAAQALARRMSRHSSQQSPEARIQFAFETCLIRPPDAEELKELLNLYREQREYYQAHPKEAASMACSELGKPQQEWPLADLAASTMVANVMLNLDEMISKN